MNWHAVKNPVKVLHPITRLIVGGAQENTLYTAQYLNPERYAVQVLTGPQAGSEGSLLNEASERGIKVTILPELVRELSPKNDYIAFKKISKLIESQRFMIVHTHSSKAGILGRLAAHRSGSPIILHTVHGWSFHNHMHPFRRLMYIYLEKLAYHYCDALIFVSKKDIDRGKLARIVTKENFFLVRSAIPLENFNPGIHSQFEARSHLNIPHEVPVLGNIGRFTAQKDPLSWIQVAANVHSILPDCWFLMVGDGPLRPQVEEAIVKTGISNRTVLTGLRRDIPELLAAMDVFLITSLWEGLPRVIPQAMAMGLPVVSNQVDGIEEAVTDGKNGFLAKPGDYPTLAYYCIRLLKESSLRLTLGFNGKASIQHEFSLDQMIAQIEKIYEDLLVKKNPRALGSLG